ncbi:uncharacterized protein LOC100881039 isoform X2 [Megachile rotundata]|nr:PREDICTED: pre-mRNA-splicing factor CWC25 homolog isoform X2 [Megachile rotundata]
MKNIEKVWKAEQQQHQEKKKIAELKKELEIEKDREDMKKYAMEQGVIEKKDDKKLDWMYKGPNQLVNREEYLLGRPIDKSFEQLAQAEKEVNQAKNHVEHECIPPSLRFFSGNEQVDLARKMQEDPLYAIKKKEMETRSQLLKNPVKLKQLRQLLEQQSKKNKSEKKQKKKKKHKHSADSDDESQLDMLLVTKYKQLKERINDKDLIKSMKKVKHKRKKKLKNKHDSTDESESSSEENSSDEDVKKHKGKASKSRGDIETWKHGKDKYDVDKKESNKQISKKRIRSRSSSTESNSNSVHKRRNNAHRKDTNKTENKNYNSRSPRSREHSSHRNKYNHRSRNEDKYTSSKLHQKEITHSKSLTDTVQKNSKEENLNKDRWNSKKKHTLTEEEKEKRRQEMIANATWRDKELERNVKKYREEEKKEIDSSKVYNQDFVRKQLAVAAEVGTVASRIKANINNIQRSGRAMDTNFAKR